MNCQQAQELIQSYGDGELELAGSLEVERHMQECQICANAYSRHTTLTSALKNSSLYYTAPDKLEKRIRASLRKEAKSEQPRRAFVWRWATATVALALLLMLAFLVWRPGSFRSSGDELLAQEIVSNHVRSLLPGGSHLTDVLSSDQHTVKPWFDGKVDFAPPVRDFASQDFPLYGGRLEYLNNRTVATLIYKRRLHYINLYVWPTDQAGSSAETTVQRQGYNMIHWKSGGMNFWAISDLNAVELQEFARLVQQQQ